MYDGYEEQRVILLEGHCFEDDAKGFDGDWLRDTDTEVVEVTNPVTGHMWMDRNRPDRHRHLMRSNSLRNMDACLDWNLVQGNK